MGLENTPLIKRAVCLKWLGFSTSEEDRKSMHNIMRSFDCPKNMSIVILRSSQLDSSLISVLGEFLRMNISVEELWLENTLGLTDDFVEETQKVNPFIRIKVNNVVHGHKTFLPRKVYLHSLEKAREIFVQAPCMPGQRTCTRAWIYWSKSKNIDVVCKLVS